MQLRLNVTRSAEGMGPGDVVVLYARVLHNELSRSELTVELITNTLRGTQVVSYIHCDPAQLTAFYESEDD